MIEVGLDARGLAVAKWPGISQYTYYLLVHMLQQAPDLSLHLLYDRPKRGREARPVFQGRTRPVEPPVPVDWRWIYLAQELSGWPRVTDLMKSVRLFHSVNHRLMPAGRARVVATVYDLTRLLMPELHVGRQGRYRRQLELVARRADHLLAISAHTKRDLVEHLSVPPERISVTPLAASPEFQPVDRDWAKEQVRSRYGLERPYVLYVGTLEPRKNLVRLMEAFSRLPQGILGEFQLVLAGARGWKDEAIQAQLHAPHWGGRLRWIEYVPRADLPLLMSAAEVFAYPSLYEGFGLPPLEAMSCGAPVLTSDCSSLPEVVGDAGILVDPHSADAIQDGLRRLLESDALRHDLRRRGQERAAGFSWKKTADETLAVYRQLLTG